MVAQVDKLPETFVPFEALTVCGNLLKAGKAPFVIGQTVPLLVGKNSHPMVWLSAPRNSLGTEWLELIEAGKPRHPEVKIYLSEDEKEISVQFRRQSILELRVTGADNAEITYIDFRLIGLNIFGDGSALNLGSNRLSNNSFLNVGYMAKLG